MPDDLQPIRLHSRYDPEKEAVRFLDAQKILFSPSFIIITEPGDSYVAQAIRNCFPYAKIVAIRYQNGMFESSDVVWDYVWRPKSNHDIQSFLFQIIPDELLPLTVFWAWNPADKYWPEMAKTVWTGIANMIKLQTSVMHTRSYFGQRWLRNMIRNVTLSNKIVTLNKTKKPIFLAAAGPSLEKHIPFLRDAFFVLAVSSAQNSLIFRNCIPDACIATDGGYWALRHFQGIPDSVPVAFPLEAAIPSDVLGKNPLVLLDYGSELEKCLFGLMKVYAVPASRNGTVSGTSAIYALSHTASMVFAAGLDLQPSSSYNHARPHASDPLMDCSSSRLNPLAGILYSSNRDTAPLDTYASWFNSRDPTFRERFIRLFPNGRKIDGIRDVQLSEVKLTEMQNENNVYVQQSVEGPTRRALILQWLQSITDKLISQINIDKTGTARQGLETGFLHDPLFTEIFQLVAYTDYINVLKKSQQFDTNDLFYSLYSELCQKTVSFFRVLIEMVKRYE